jgi:hypothetical protein
MISVFIEQIEANTGEYNTIIFMSRQGQARQETAPHITGRRNVVFLKVYLFLTLLKLNNILYWALKTFVVIRPNKPFSINPNFIVHGLKMTQKDLIIIKYFGRFL